MLGRSRRGIGVGVGVDILRPDSELESLNIRRLRSPAATATALTSKDVHVVVYAGGHLELLDLGAAAVGQQDHDVDVVEPADRLDGRAARVPRGGNHDQTAVPRGREERLEPAEQVK